jgi:hypothetical protein
LAPYPRRKRDQQKTVEPARAGKTSDPARVASVELPLVELISISYVQEYLFDFKFEAPRLTAYRRKSSVAHHFVSGQGAYNSGYWAPTTLIHLFSVAR